MSAPLSPRPIQPLCSSEARATEDVSKNDGEHSGRSEAVVDEKGTENDPAGSVSPAPARHHAYHAHADTATNKPKKAVPETRPIQKTIVTSAQPVQRNKTGFQLTTSYPSSYVGMPADTTGITIGKPEEAA